MKRREGGGVLLDIGTVLFELRFWRCPSLHKANGRGGSVPQICCPFYVAFLGVVHRVLAINGCITSHLPLSKNPSRLRVVGSFERSALFIDFECASLLL